MWIWWIRIWIRIRNTGGGGGELAAGSRFDSLLGHVVRALGGAVVPHQVLQEAEEQRVHRHRVHAEEAAAQQVIDLTKICSIHRQYRLASRGTSEASSSQ